MDRRTAGILKRAAVAAVIAVLALSATGAVQRAEAGPRLEPEKAHLDLGTVREGIKAHVTFVLTNTGDEQAVIQRIDSSAACTSTGLSTRKLAPGEKLEMKFIFETLGYGGRSPTRSVTVHYNSDEYSPLALQASGKILPTEPHQAPLGELSYNFFVLVDVRSAQKFKAGHILGAINVPSGELMEWMKKVPKHVLVYLYSDTGKLSDRMARRLRREEYSQVKSLVGGLEEWTKRHGDELTVTGDK